MYDFDVEAGIRHVARAEQLVAEGRIDYAFGALIKAQRNFDRAVMRWVQEHRDRHNHPLEHAIMDAIAARVAADLDRAFLYGN